MIKKVSQNIYKELSTSPVNFLLGNVGDKLRIETVFKIETYAVSSIDNPFTVNHTDGTIGDGWVYDPQGQFKDFKVGDTVRYYIKSGGATALVTIVDKLDDFNIQLSSALSVAENYLATDWIFSITNAITGIKYKYNFIENDEAENFLSKVDGSEQVLAHEVVDADDVTVLDMSFLGKKDYQIGSATIEGVSIDDGSTSGVYSNTFKIKHYTYLTPFILASELDGEGNPTLEPEYYKNGKCLKFIWGIDALYEYTDPNGVISQVFSDVIGDTGWRNENYNQGATNYNFDSLDYSGVDLLSIPGIKLSSEKTSVHFSITNDTDAPFTSSTKLVLNIVKVPFSESEYQDQGKTLDKNFLFDRAAQLADGSSVNGENYGTDYQIIKNLIVTLGGATNLTVEFDVEMGAEVLSNLNASETPSYRMFVSIQDDTIDTDSGDNDLVTLFIDDYNQFYIDTTDDDMIVIDEVRMIRHPEGDADAEGISNKAAPGTFSSSSQVGNISSSISTGTLGYADDNAGANYVAVATPTTTLSYPVANQAALDAWIAAMTITSGWSVTSQFIGGGQFSIGLKSPDSTGADFNGKYLYTTMPFSIFFFNVQFDGGVNEIPADILQCFPEDEIVSSSKFYIDRDGREDDEIVLTAVQNKIVVKNTSTLKYFEIDGCTVNTSFYPQIGEVQYMDAQMARDIHVPVETIRKYVELKRRIDLDGSDKYWYQLNFPFLFRWEYWVKLIGANSDFFDTSLPNNGFNHWWFHYKTGNWKIYNKIIVNATKNGVAQQYISYNEIIPNDYNSNTDWTTKNIKTYSADGTVELYDSGSGKRFIYSDKDTLVKANFTKNDTPGNITVEIKIEIWEQGGYYGLRIYSSRWVSDGDTWFKSTDGSDKVVLTPSGNSVEAKCLIDYSLLPAASSYKISARIYEGGFGLLTDDSVPITTDDGVFITID